MQEHWTFIRDDILPSWWANAIQRFIGVGAFGFRLAQDSDTIISVPAGPDDEAAAIGIDGRWRWNEATVTRAHPGGPAGEYPIWVVTAANDVDNVPEAGTDNTDYAFDLRITAPEVEPALLPGTVDHFRQVGVAVWDGDRITSLGATVGAPVVPPEVTWARIELGGIQVIPSGEWTDIRWNTIVADTSNHFGNVAPTPQIFAREPGVYLVVAGVKWGTNNIGSRKAKLHVDPAAGTDYSGKVASAVVPFDSAADSSGCVLAAIVPLVEDQPIRVSVLQETGVNQNVSGDPVGFPILPTETFISLVKLTPSVAGGGGGGGGATSRQELQLVTAALALDAHETGDVALPRGTQVIRVEADKACRVRLYMTAADRDAAGEAAREFLTDPEGDHGLILDVQDDAADLLIRPAAAIGHNFDDPVADQLYYRVTQLDAGGGAVTVDFTYVAVEA